MKTLFIRLLIVWLIAGQLLYVVWSHLQPKEPTPLEREYAHDPSPAGHAALEKELDRFAEYESRRAVALITLSLAVDGVIIFFFWNSGTGKRQSPVREVPVKSGTGDVDTRRDG